MTMFTSVRCKLKINFYALQVIYLYSKIISNRDVEYPNPAKEFAASYLQVNLRHMISPKLPE